MYVILKKGDEIHEVDVMGGMRIGEGRKGIVVYMACTTLANCFSGFLDLHFMKEGVGA